MEKNKILTDKDPKITLLRKMIPIFLFIAFILLSSYTAVFYYYGIKTILPLLYLYLLQHLMLLFGFWYIKDLSIGTLIKLYLFYIIAAFYPIACIYWNSGDVIVFFWYLLIMIGAIIFDFPNMKIWIFWILAVVISVFFTSSLFPVENFPVVFKNPTNILTVISSIVLAAFFAILQVKMRNIERSMFTEMLLTTEKNTEHLERDKTLYEAIIKYIEENKAFKNPDFSAQALAKALNSNVAYISKAINAGGEGNLNILLNKFRINYIKYRLDNGALKKYTIDHLYAEAGYKHRSTFYTAFKSITGMTPSDYVSQQNTNSN